MNGIRLDGKKQTSLISWTIRRPEPPSRVKLLLTPGTLCVVEAGMHVQTGQVLARPEYPDAVSVHASISGKILSVEALIHPSLGETVQIVIESDKRDEKITGLGTERPGWEQLEGESLLEVFRDSGLVDLEESMTAVHSKILGFVEPPQLLIINACESEPYITGEHSLTMSHGLEVLKGAEILRRASGAKRILVAFEETGIEAAELLKSKVFFLKWNHCDVHIFRTQYPQEMETVLKKEAGALALRPEDRDPKQMLVFRAATAYAAYEAVVFHKPLYERVLTVGGECVVEPRNLWVRLGMEAGDVFKICKGLLREPRKVLLGGPMRGTALSRLDYSIPAGARALLALPKEVAGQEEARACIRCARCDDACPVGISPARIGLSVERGQSELARFFGVEACIFCGNCAYVCPSHRPMVELMEEAARGGWKEGRV